MRATSTAEQPVASPPASDLDFAATFARVGDGLYRLALAITADAAVAEDLVQEAFARVWRRRRRLRDAEHLDRTLYVAARNLAYDHRRREERAGRALQQVARLVRDEAQPGGDGPDAEHVDRALFKLPVEQREVVLLHVYEGRTFPEVARLTEAPLGTVHSRYRYAMDRLRALLHVAVGGDS